MQELNALSGHIQCVLRSLVDDALTARQLRTWLRRDRFDGIKGRYADNVQKLEKLVAEFLSSVDSEFNPVQER